MRRLVCPVCGGLGYSRIVCGYCNGKGHIYQSDGVDKVPLRPERRNDQVDESTWNRVFVDLDGVMARSLWPFSDEDVPNFPLIEKTVESLQEVKDAGIRIIIWTARSKNLERVTLEWLQKNGIPYDELWMEKPPFIAFLDDRAFNFDGSWDGIPERLINFQTWLEVERDGAKSFATKLAMRQRDERIDLYNAYEQLKFKGLLD